MTYKQNLEQTRENDKAHDQAMTVIAKRGGKTLEEMRKLTRKSKDAFIVKWAGK